MPKIRSQRVPYPEHPALDISTKINWEDLRVFLVVARHRSFRSAAEELGFALNTVRRHIERLEHAAKFVVLARNPNGVSLTREGENLFSRALAMEEAAKNVHRIGNDSAHDLRGRVRVSVTEGLGTFWLAPQLVPFQRANPNLVMEINCTFRAPDLARMEADVSIQLTKPKQADLKVVKLGRMHVMPFASPEYLKLYGTPTTVEDVENHKIVEQLSPQLDVAAVDRIFPGKDRAGFVAFATNTSTTHFWCVIRGAGLGMLPTYLAHLGARIVPVDIDLTVAHDIWLTYHPDSKRSRRVARTIECIKDSFNADKYEWFKDQFIHPRDFTDNVRPLSEDLRFDGLVAHARDR